MSIADFTPAQTQDLATSLAVLLLHDLQVEVSADNLTEALSAAGVTVASYLPSLYANAIERGLKVSKALAGPSAGGAAAAAPAAGAGAAAPKKEEQKEEEEEADLGGGMDMFGGSSDY
ncbi:hypothetical protein H257_07798 [Aphanomyces astaci]|uniref:60S acidic ribosomal protein P1 n=1 Tax=Aphanomyces astaci TaxID=112090 RepID=W4GH51_APHAT|nr:hypothetical protein H257_07798 [Aphanomyces astaci]ETV79025.1 hypothetical protein H257_07798 [Aphanomyces astaci]RHY51578.1 hypothetical protein DYB38_005762 [Aphanomyces astaci]RHY56229.1 hypothetical protein DYB30_012299 [Aphanomyces astaci]RHZ09953.1 hypothetical protein DYB37_004429 [Aphanomyces astaci]RLO07185.1 hypothetical protein DYB28_004253 [Aphanomyces astaci]|eukprot:XP_009831744.1 hypothetical protein H257_07798 [Aphanomyces astaci]